MLFIVSIFGDTLCFHFIIVIIVIIVIASRWADLLVLILESAISSHILIYLLRIFHKCHEVLAFEGVDWISEGLIVRNTFAMVWLHLIPQEVFLDDASLSRWTSN